MPRSSEQYYNPNTKRYENREVGVDEDGATKTKVQDASGLGSKVKGDAFKPPAMRPNESSSEYGARVAAARRAHEAAQVEGQRQALKGLK